MECKTSDQYEEEGLTFYGRGDFARALRCFQEGAVRFPGDRDLLLGAAMGHLNMGDYPEACSILEDLYARHGGGGDLLHGLAEAYLNLGRAEAAVDCVRQALRTEPSSELANRLGQTVYKHGLLMEAARCHALAARWQPGCARAFIGLGVCNHRLGRAAAAIRILYRALDIDPANVEALSYLGNIFYERGDFQRARELWARIPLESLGDPATLRRLRKVAGWPAGDARWAALDERLRRVLRGREPRVMELLERLAPA